VKIQTVGNKVGGKYGMHGMGKNVRIILKWILKEYNRRVLTSFI
jgi:hypothetical protein